jgi:hypothetical protein
MAVAFAWGLALACSRKRSSPPAASGAAEAGVTTAVQDAGEASGAVRVAETPPVFSLPIAAARAQGTTIVAGYVASEAVVRVVALRGRDVAWTSDVIRGAAWAPDAELKLEPLGDGVALFWRGGRGVGTPGSLVLLGAAGQRISGADDVGASGCATSTGLSWLTPLAGDRHAPTRVRARATTDDSPSDVLVVPADRTPSLYCGTHGAFVLADGDDDILSTWVAPGEATAHAPVVVLRDADFADDERDHYAFTAGDALAFVRLGDTGDVAIRHIVSDASPGPWRRSRRAIESDDDVVEVDGHPDMTVIVVASQAGPPCSSTGAPSDRIQALRFDSSERPVAFELAPPDCGQTLGPFWIAERPDGGGLTVVWGVGASASQGGSAPIGGLGFRAVGGAPTGPLGAGQLAVDAFDVVRAGCDASGCFAAVLERPADGDAMRPMAIAVFRLF